MGEMQNRTDSYPGVGYPGGYYERHNNETLPTSPSAPSVGGGSGMNLANSTVPSGCDCQQMENLSNPTPPGGVAGALPEGAPGAGGLPEGAPDAGGLPEGAPAAGGDTAEGGSAK